MHSRTDTHTVREMILNDKLQNGMKCKMEKNYKSDENGLMGCYTLHKCSVVCIVSSSMFTIPIIKLATQKREEDWRSNRY